MTKTEETKAETAAAPAAKSPAKKRPARPKINRKLTPEQRAEAAALWRAGSVTLDDLSKKFGKRPENFSRMFRNMGIVKGSAVAETEKKMAEEVAARAASNVSRELERIATMKDQHFQMSSSLAKIAFAEITRARQAGLKLESLKDTMLTLKLAGEIIGNSRKEQYALLRVEEHDKDTELEDLPELQVRELSQEQILEMQSRQPIDELDDAGFDDGAGDVVLGEPEEGP
ncbi:hypothetical protein GFK26_18470 [Variovorax paradoxus]|uniref:DNA-binding protein n=1 Tax=Variovorax paradoxus TaxID=34073 RepID=A0A5Q0M4Z9_VARPD|nr:hypothetical protein [Variovorax paradoxus]QFZ84613.1 hypothetical protein GFK26_18470 [Variovorax paradoxus]